MALTIVKAYGNFFYTEYTLRVCKVIVRLLLLSSAV